MAKARCRSGVRCAEMIFASWPMPSSSSVLAACFMVCQSDWLPMMIATGFPAIDTSTPKTKPAIIRATFEVARLAKSRGSLPVTLICASKISQLECISWRLELGRG